MDLRLFYFHVTTYTSLSANCLSSVSGNKLCKKPQTDGCKQKHVNLIYFNMLSLVIFFINLASQAPENCNSTTKQYIFNAKVLCKIPKSYITSSCGNFSDMYSFGKLYGNSTEAFCFQKISTPGNQLKIQYFFAVLCLLQESYHELVYYTCQQKYESMKQ